MATNENGEHMKHQPVATRAGRGLHVGSIAIAIGLFAGPASAADLNPDADEILHSMSSFLAGTQSFSVDADIENEIINLEGQKLQFNSSSTSLIDRPSRLYVTRRGRVVDAELRYDGATLTVFSRKLNAYVKRDLSGTIDDAIVAIESGTGLSAPGADLLLSDSYAAVSSGVVSSGYYGTAYVGGIECHHLAFRADEVDWQLWVKAGDEPLPMKYVITTKWVTGAPQYSVQLSNWNLKPQVADQQFELSPPEGAQRVEALTVDEAGEMMDEAVEATSLEDGK